MIIKIIALVVIVVFILATLPFQLDQIGTTKNGESYYGKLGLKGCLILAGGIALFLMFALNDPNL